MEEIIEKPIQVYIKVNENNEIIDITSNIFITDLTEWLEIDIGFGDKYAHAQSQYFDKPLMTEDGKYVYRYENGKIIEVEN